MKQANNQKLCQLVESGNLTAIKDYLSTCTKSSVLRKNSSGRDALYYAIFTGNVEIVKTLIEYGFNPKSIDNQTGASALHLAAGEGNFDLGVYLTASVNMDVNSVDTKGRNPLYYAMMFLNKNDTNKQMIIDPSHLDMAWLLIGCGSKFQPDMFGMQLELETVERMLLNYIHEGIKAIDCDQKYSNYISFLKDALNYYYLFYKDIRNTSFHRWCKNIHACYIVNNPIRLSNIVKKTRTKISKLFGFLHV